MMFPDLAGAVIGDRIRFDEKPIGAGSYGEVWPAHHLNLGSPLAVKVVDIRDADRETIERLQRECHIHGKINRSRPPGVVFVHDVIEEAQRFYIVMEMVDGGNLNDYLLSHTPDFTTTLQWAIELCRTMSWLHSREIIHRDLKPQNILLTSDGQPKICDFGIARIPLSTLTERQPGTILYMAPELLEAHPATTASDVYSLCAVFFEMWSGRRYFDLRLLSKDDITKEFEDCSKARYPNVGISILDVLADIVLSGLQKNPVGRTGLSGMQRRLEWLAQQMKTSESFLTRDIPPKIPFERNEQFVGRSEELDHLHTMLQQERWGGIRPAMLTGLGGVGKTQLAVEYAYRYSSHYPGGVYWINAAQDWLTELANLAINVGLPVESSTDSERDRKSVV